MQALPRPGSLNAPKYWRYETGGQLAPAVSRFIRGESLSLRDISLLREYLRQWVESPVWEMNASLDYEGQVALVKLRAKVLGAKSKAQLEDCIQMATHMGMDPL